jgi:hypothetical protein
MDNDFTPCSSRLGSTTMAASTARDARATLVRGAAHTRVAANPATQAEAACVEESYAKGAEAEDGTFIVVAALCADGTIRETAGAAHYAPVA